MPAPIVHVDMNSRGAWEVAVPAPDQRVVCPSLEDAKRVAYLCAARRHPCELVVRDAYHRVVSCEVIDGADEIG